MTKKTGLVVTNVLGAALAASGAYVYNDAVLRAEADYPCCGHGDPPCTTLHVLETCKYEDDCWFFDECCNNKCTN